MTDNKDPFCQLELVFRDPRIASICERFEILHSMLPGCSDIDLARKIFTELSVELLEVLIEQAHAHLGADDAEEFIENVDEIPTADRLTALLSVYRRNRAAAQNGDAA